MTLKDFVKKWRHFGIDGNFLETSIFRPKPVPMSFVGTLVDLELLNQLFGPKNGKMGRKMGKWAEKYRDPHYKLSQLLIEI